MPPKLNIIITMAEKELTESKSSTFSYNQSMGSIDEGRRHTHGVIAIMLLIVLMLLLCVDPTTEGGCRTNLT